MNLHHHPLPLAASLEADDARFRRRRMAVLLAGAMLVLSAALAGAQHAGATPLPESGMICTESPSASFTLTTNTGYVGIPDGNSIFMWSFSSGNDAFQLPGPTLCVDEGDTVTVILHNTLDEPVSLIFPGQENVLANGVPSQPVEVAGDLVSLAPSAAPGGSMTYSFVASEPGTYLYESGTDQAKQVQMGLFGSLVVRPAGHPTWAYDDASTAFKPGNEYIMVMSEVDPDLHRAVQRGTEYDWTAFHPRYWMLNGRSFPDTIAPNGASWLPSQPYSSMVHVQPYDESTNPLPALVRYVNIGTRNHPFHPHGNHGRVIGRDGRQLDDGGDLSYEKYLILVGSGQTWDVTYNWRADLALGAGIESGQGWDPNTNPIPPIPQLQNLTFKDDATWYSGSPYLGMQDELPVGTTSFNECGEYYHMWHSHALNESANYDAGFGGMMTLERIDPPGGCP